MCLVLGSALLTICGEPWALAPTPGKLRGRRDNKRSTAIVTGCPAWPVVVPEDEDTVAAPTDKESFLFLLAQVRDVLVLLSDWANF